MERKKGKNEDDGSEEGEEHGKEVEEKKVSLNFSHGMQKCPWETIS